MFPSTILTPKVQEFVNTYARVSPRLNTFAMAQRVRNWRDMLRKDPVSRFCVEVIFLYMFSMLGEYQHPKLSIRKDIRNSLNNLDDWHQSLRMISSVLWYGYSWSEIATEDTSTNRKTLKEIRTLDPSSYQFSGSNGEITEVFYFGTIDLELDYNTGIHLVEGLDFSFDYQYGCGRCEAIYAYWELHQLMMPVLAIAGQRQSTPILVKKCDTNTDVILINIETGQPYLDEFNNPILVKKGWDSIQQLEQLGSAGITVIDPDDDLYSIEIKCDGQFILNIIKTSEMYRMMGFLVPTTVGSFSLSGLGDSGLAQYHLSTFQTSCRSSIDRIMNRIVQKLLRPLIIYNYGEQPTYGWFSIDDENPNALEVAKVAISAIQTGKIGLDHIDIINKIRDDLGLPEFDPNAPENQPQDV